MRIPKYLVIHCSATKLSQDIPVSTIKKWHVKGRGWSDVGYHYYIRKDGSLELGRDRDGDGDIWEEIGAHVRNFNSKSVGICYEGGLDESGEPKDTRTKEQLITMSAIVKVISSQFKGIKIRGHKDFPNVAKSCPCFEVLDWCDEIGVKHY